MTRNLSCEGQNNKPIDRVNKKGAQMCLRHLKKASVLHDSGECLQKRPKRQAGTRLF